MQHLKREKKKEPIRWRGGGAMGGKDQSESMIMKTDQSDNEEEELIIESTNQREAF